MTTEKLTDNVLGGTESGAVPDRRLPQSSKEVSSISKSFANIFSKPEEYTLEGYLELCKTNKLAYANAAERMIAAIGPAKVVDTSEDPRLSRIYSNRKIRIYEAFQDFYGLEDVIERIVTYFRNAAAGLEESKNF